MCELPDFSAGNWCVFHTVYKLCQSLPVLYRKVGQSLPVVAMVLNVYMQFSQLMLKVSVSVQCLIKTSLNSHRGDEVLIPITHVTLH